MPVASRQLHHAEPVEVVLVLMPAMKAPACDGVVQGDFGPLDAEVVTMICRAMHSLAEGHPVRLDRGSHDGRAVRVLDGHCARIGEPGHTQHQATRHNGQPNSLEHDLPFPVESRPSECARRLCNGL